jgi:hypothetical protein
MRRPQIAYRPLDAADLDRIGEIDRTERIETMYVQHGARLEERAGDWSATPWSSDDWNRSWIFRRFALPLMELSWSVGCIRGI